MKVCFYLLLLCNWLMFIFGVLSIFHKGFSGIVGASFLIGWLVSVGYTIHICLPFLFKYKLQIVKKE